MASRKISAELSKNIQKWFWTWLVDHPDVSISKMAEKAKIDSSYLYNIRKGTVTASIDKLVKLADYTGASIDEICGRVKERSR